MTHRFLPTKAFRYLCRIVPALTICLPLAAADLNVLNNTTVDANALNFAAANVNFGQNVNGRTHQRFPISTFRGYQYVTYYDSNRKVALGRRKLPAGNWEIIRFTDYTITNHDSHNTATLGICTQDGTIHLAFDHHKDPLHYRVSNVGVALDPDSVTWSTTLFSSVTDRLGPLGAINDLTYPTFIPAPNGNLLFYYRNGGSGSGDGIIYEYNGTTHSWTSGMGQFISRNGTYNGAVSVNSTTRNPYLNGISYGGNRLHASWGWRESSGGAQFNHDLNYAYSDDHGRTWRNNSGAVIGIAGSSSISINSSGLLVASIEQNIGLSNAYTQYEYDDGSVHVMVSHHEAGTTSGRYHHYWRNSSGTWSFEALPFTGSRPKMVGDDDRTLFLVYKTGGRINVAKGAPNTTQTAWTWTVIHTQSDTTEGGDGLLDYERWDSERILSVYGQESPNAAGDPTPLHVYDYQVSAKAVLPVPAHELAGVAESTTLQWTAGIGAVSHRVYFGTDFTSVRDATTASPEYLGQQSTTQFTPASPLHEATHYHWRIDEVDGSGTVTRGLIWRFSTPGNFAPTITAIADQTTARDTSLPALAFSIDDDNTAAASLQVTVRSSNPVLLPVNGITLGGSGANRTVQITPTAGQPGVGIVSIRVSDGTKVAEEHISVNVTGPLELILSSAEDAGIKETPDPADTTAATTYVGTGGGSPRVDRSVVFVFQLPDLGASANPFANASFTFDYTAKDGTLQNNDLYGLGRRPGPTVLAGDYYGQTTTLDNTDATLLQRNILTDATGFGLINPGAAGQSALRDYLNAQYASGAGVGEYVFLRLNTAGKRDAIDRATVTMSEGGQATPTDTRPRVSFTRALANQAPTLTQIDDLSVPRDAPLPLLEFAIADDNTAPGGLQVSAQSSNPLLLPQSGITLGGSGANRTIQLTPAPGKTGTALVTIHVNDGSLAVQKTFTLTVTGPIEVLLSTAEDASIKEDFVAVDADKTTTLLGTGGGSPRVDRATVYVFQLPDLGSAAAPFESASFAFDYSAKDGTLQANDLYGIGRRPSPTVLGSDYYGKTDTLDATDATLLQRDILTDATSFGIINPSAAGQSALRDYLNAQYASGAGVGEYVFLRLNTAGKRDAIDRATLTMSEGAQSSPIDTRPRISFTRVQANQAPSITQIADQTVPRDATLPSIAFAIDDDSTPLANLQLTAQSSNPGLLPPSGITLGGSGNNRTIQLAPTAGQTGVSTITISVNDGTLVTQETFTLTITGPLEVILSLVQDASIKDNLDVVDASATTSYTGTGGASPVIDRSLVYVFQLPDLGPVAAPFVTASFTFEYAAMTGTPNPNDLYGLGRRTSPTVLGSDYYGKVTTPDSTDAALLENDIVTGVTPLGMITTSTAGSSALRNYLNTQYASGAGAGQYVFLRLSTADYQDQIQRANFTMSEGGQTTPLDTRPRIAFTRIPANPLDDWRLLYFGSTSNTGNGADDADPNQDGESNLLEFATGQDPNAATIASVLPSVNGANFEFRYPRSKAAMTDGLTFTVQWIDTLATGTWSSAGITEAVETEDANKQNVVATIPMGATTHRFFRLFITR